MGEKVEKIKSSETYQHLISQKIDYIVKVADELNIKIDKWISDLVELSNDKKFDWIELKPIISHPDVLIQ